MTTKFKDIPAEQWEKEFYADELKEDRKADRPARRKASNYAAAFIALMDAAGIPPEHRQTWHIFLAKTRGQAPDEALKFSEADAGKQLPGGTDVAEASFKRKWVRRFRAAVEDAAGRGKSLGRRENGSIILASRKAGEKKLGPTYYSEIAHAVVEVERRAGPLRVRRDEGFKRAAIEVWTNLPNAAPQPATEDEAPRAKPKPRTERLAGKKTRRMTRFLNAAREILIEKKAESEAALEAETERLHMEIETLAAEMRGEHVADTNSDADSQISLENRTFEPPHVDTSVHVEPAPTHGFCVACDDAIHPQRLQFDTELCDVCSLLWINDKPTVLRMIDELEQRKKGQDGIIYAEDFEA